MRVCCESLGCRSNQSEIEDIARQLVAIGCTIVDRCDDPDLCIINTCAVTSEAERRSQRAIARVTRRLPQAKLVVTGCYATRVLMDGLSVPGADWLIGNEQKEQVVAILAPLVELRAGSPACDRVPESSRDECAYRTNYIPALHTRAFLKVQDGCDNACAYCLTRILRGPSRSSPVSLVIRQVQELVELGYVEIVLCGVNLGAYGRDLGFSGGLSGLVKAILRDTDVTRLRLSSIEPWDVDGDFLDLWTEPRLCQHLHLPLQSGCDATLGRMERNGSIREFVRLIELARSVAPDMAVTTDVIVGFPGESEADFEASYAAIAEIGFSKLHVFPFSARPHTSAFHMPDHVSAVTIRARARKMRRLGVRLNLEYGQRHVGKRATVLWERLDSGDRWSGLTGNYIRVVAYSKSSLHNTLSRVRLLRIEDGSMVGQLEP
ncbi:MAG: tRNA (N(6)-L-threonylcarbamoyladenosine(37)-C(2))-methylthiotransferase MtaB [Chloroflexi bacterium]|nr:tRNA (N(6)-L-threonylcarbamoyladenosine(37)-C(2))-methylthiotransferase MtaB [Chloroflexota bacterium]